MPTVLVAYAEPGSERLVTLALPAGACVGDAVTASGLLAPLGPAALTLRFAIFGAIVAADTPLREGDRVELTRPLAADPKAARRVRAALPQTPTSRQDDH
jgi:putative ubiquitin-RnfH superfamily antitoxin RatB of RatAB toxin-antitoxin module